MIERAMRKRRWRRMPPQQLLEGRQQRLVVVLRVKRKSDPSLLLLYLMIKGVRATVFAGLSEVSPVSHDFFGDERRRRGEGEFAPFCEKQLLLLFSSSLLAVWESPTHYISSFLFGPSR
jgi:hypothetical protein